MVIGRKAGDLIRLPGFRLVARAEACTSCGTCAKHCPMSLDTDAIAKAGMCENVECILCATAKKSSRPSELKPLGTPGGLPFPFDPYLIHLYLLLLYS
jgi:hypothetical protein